MLGLLAAQRVADGAFLLRATQDVKHHPVDRRVLPPLPLTTGPAAHWLGVTEPQLADTVRRGHVAPPPPILAGRRLWSREHLLQAAEALDLLTDDLRAVLAEEVARG